jgi:hypothetical protein
MNRDLLQNLHGMAEFKMLLKELKSRKPIIPTFNPTESNIELMKFRSGELSNYELMMKIMNPWGDTEI